MASPRLGDTAPGFTRHASAGDIHSHLCLTPQPNR